MTDDYHDQRRARVRLEILRVLAGLSGNAQEEGIILAETNLHLGSHARAELSEFRAELTVLVEMGYVAIVKPLIGGARWVSATTAGMGYVAANR